MTKRTYSCNLCRTEIGLPPLKSGYGIIFTTNEAIVLDFPAKAEHHICHHCLSSLRYDILDSRIEELYVSISREL